VRETGGATVRSARQADDAALSRIDALTWTALVSPAAAPPVGTAFFNERTQPVAVLVAELDGALAGYAKLGQSVQLASHEHVLDLTGLAVAPAYHRRGVGRLLVEATVTEARRRGARKLALRVLAPNLAARRLYRVCGFNVEGVLRAEFLLDGQYVDDVLMARTL
jgi:ribosomal protein S18 acetylase RimI-like enzyme